MLEKKIEFNLFFSKVISTYDTVYIYISTSRLSTLAIPVWAQKYVYTEFFNEIIIKIFFFSIFAYRYWHVAVFNSSFTFYLYCSYQKCIE